MDRLLKLVTIAMFLSASLTAQADEYETAPADEGDWYVVQLAAYTDDDGDRRLDDSAAGGEFRIGRRWSDVFAFEGLVGYHKIDGWPSWPVVQERQYQKFLDLSLNVVSSLNSNGNISPYLIVGAGYLGTKTELGAEDNRPSGTAGLGLKVRFGDSPWSLRAEWRLRHAFDSENSLTDRIGSLGIRYSFGGSSDHMVMAAVSEPEPVVEPDTDGDGVVDSQDACPNTPRGIPVDSAGCPPDSDQDGVKDDRDQCPGTEAGVKVDVNGCDIIELKPVYFETESAVLLELARRLLDDSASILLRYPDVQVDIGGHADSRGPEDYNMELSLRRADAVRQYLEQAGVDPARMTVRGYGESRPVASNQIALGQAENRRVELQVLNR